MSNQNVVSSKSIHIDYDSIFRPVIKALEFHNLKKLSSRLAGVIFKMEGHGVINHLISDPMMMHPVCLKILDKQDIEALLRDEYEFKILVVSINYKNEVDAEVVNLTFWYEQLSWQDDENETTKSAVDADDDKSPNPQLEYPGFVPTTEKLKELKGEDLRFLYITYLKEQIKAAHQLIHGISYDGEHSKSFDMSVYIDAVNDISEIISFNQNEIKLHTGNNDTEFPTSSIVMGSFRMLSCLLKSFK